MKVQIGSMFETSRPGAMLRALAALLLAAAAIPCEAAVKVPQPFELTLAGDRASFLLSSTEDGLKDATVEVKWLEGPDGRLLAPSLLKVETPDFPSVTADGVVVVLQASQLEDYGKYKFTLVVKSESPFSGRFEGILNRNAPSISFPNLDGATIVLYRGWWWPPCPETEKREWDILGQPPGGLKADLAVQVRNAEGTALVETGRVALAAKGASPAEMTFSHFSQTGKFTGKVTAGTFMKQPEPTFTIFVTDRLLWPVLAIALGVFLAILAKEITQRLRPRSRIRLRILEISNTLRLFRDRTKDAARLREIGDLEHELGEIRQLLALDSFDQAQSQLDEISAKLRPLQASLGKDESDAIAASGRVLRLLIQIGEQKPAEYANLKARWDEADELVKEKEYPAASQLLASIQTAAEAVIKTFPGGEAAESAGAVRAHEVRGADQPLEILDERRLLAKLDWGIIGISALVAVVSGIWALYAGKPFGSVAQYCEAIVWGFGIENSVRGFAAVLNKVEA